MRKTVSMGPWRTTNIAGMPSTIPDSDLAYSENILIGRDGSLRPRPAFDILTPTVTMETSGKLLGNFFGSLYFSEKTGASGINLRRYNLTTSTWSVTSLSAGVDVDVEAAFSYKNEVYFVCSKYALAVKGGFRFNPSLNTQSAVVDLPFLPVGKATQRNAFIYKDRAWIISNNTINFSKATDPTDWTVAVGGAGFIRPDEGADSTGVIAATVLNDVMYFFKRNASYAFNYYTAPDVDGQLRRISDTKGASAGSVVSYNNRVFIFDQISVYEIINNQFVDIAEGMAIFKNFSVLNRYGFNSTIVDPIVFSTAHLHVLRNYLIVGPLYYKTEFASGIAYGDTLIEVDGVPGNVSKTWFLVCDLDTGSWMLWTTIANTVQNWWPAPIGEWASDRDKVNHYCIADYITAGTTVNTSVIRIQLTDLDFYFGNPDNPATLLGKPDTKSDTTTKQYPPYRFVTKTYDFGSRYSIKKVYKIWYDRMIKSILPSYVADTNFVYRIKYYLTYLHLSRVIGSSLDATRESASPRNFGLLPGSQVRTNQLALGMEFKMLTNTNAAADDLFNFNVGRFELEYSDRTTESGDSTL